MDHRRLSMGLVVLLVTLAAVFGVLIAPYEQGRLDVIVQRFDTRHTTATRFIEAYTAQEWTRARRVAETSFTGTVTQAQADTAARMAQLSSALLADDTGQRIVVSPANPDLPRTPDVRAQAALQAALAGRPAVTDIIVPPGRAPLVGYVVPFDAPTGRRIFAAGYAIIDTPLQPFARSALAVYSTANVYVLDSTGSVITADRPQYAGMPLARVDAPLAQSLTQDSSGYLGHGEDQRYFRVGPIAGTTWQLVYSLDTAQLFATVTPAQRWAPWAALAGFVLMGLMMIAMFTRVLADHARAEEEHEAQRAILDTAGDAFIGMDDRGRVTDWNLAATQLLGWPRSEAIGQPVSTLIVPPRDRPAHAAGLRAFLDTGTPRLPAHAITVTARHHDGHEIPVELAVSRSQWRGSWRFHGFMRDVTDRLQHEQQLRDLALTDALTGLANRRAFLDQLERAHSRARRHGTSFLVMYADVDHFKSINDTYGHAAGDEILRQVATRLRAQTRAEDTVGRLGGDEFAIICEYAQTDTDNLSTRIREALAVPYTFRGEPIPATVSIGTATPTPGEAPEHLLERADSTMYEAKARQRP